MYKDSLHCSWHEGITHEGIAHTQSETVSPRKASDPIEGISHTSSLPWVTSWVASKRTTENFRNCRALAAFQRASDMHIQLIHTHGFKEA